MAVMEHGRNYIRGFISNLDGVVNIALQSPDHSVEINHRLDVSYAHDIYAITIFLHAPL